MEELQQNVEYLKYEKNISFAIFAKKKFQNERWPLAGWAGLELGLTAT